MSCTFPRTFLWCWEAFVWECEYLAIIAYTKLEQYYSRQTWNCALVM